MNYLVSKCQLFLLSPNEDIISSNVVISPNAKYEFYKDMVLTDASGRLIVVSKSFYARNVVKVQYDVDNYFFVFYEKENIECNIQIKFGNRLLCVMLSKFLTVSVDGKMLVEKRVQGLKYASYEIISTKCFIYFDGERRFCVVIENDEIKMSDYYDEFNAKEKSRMFMCKKYDMLNHGKVYNFTNGADSYLVYLDDYTLDLKMEYVLPVFMDCVMNGNTKYANSLLNKDIQLQDHKLIVEFFPKFDDYYLLDDKVFLFFDNGFVGSFSFEIDGLSISNISQND